VDADLQPGLHPEAFDPPFDPIGEHQSVSNELMDALRDQGTLAATRARRWRDNWLSLHHLPVTERRETVTAACADLDAELAIQTAEVAALRVHLTHLELLLK
jgi:hypothetical protein